MATKNELFLEEFGMFQGNMQEASFDAFYEVLHSSMRPKLLMLINTPELFKKAFDKGLKFDGTNNIDNHWNCPYTVEHIKLLEEYNYPRLKELYKAVITQNKKNAAAVQYIYQNISMDMLLETDKSQFEKNELEMLFQNKNFDLFKYIENRNEIKKSRGWISEETFSLIVKHYPVEQIVDFAKKKYCYFTDILSYMINEDLIGSEILNQKGESQEPLYNRFSKVSCYIDKKTGKFFEEIDFNLVNKKCEYNIIDKLLGENNNKLGVFKTFLSAIKPEYINLSNKEGKTAAFIISNSLYHENRMDYIESVLNSGIDLTLKNAHGNLFFESSMNNVNLSTVFQIIFEKDKWNITDPKFDKLREVLYEKFGNSVNELNNNAYRKSNSLRAAMKNMLVSAEKIILEAESTINIESKNKITRI